VRLSAATRRRRSQTPTTCSKGHRKYKKNLTSSVKSHLLQRIGILCEIVGGCGWISVIANCSNSSANHFSDNQKKHHRHATTCRNSSAQESRGCYCSGNIEPTSRPEVITVITGNSTYPIMNSNTNSQPYPHRRCSEVQGR
jgi:hypothetical protein